MNNHPFHVLSVDLRESDPLCRYVTIERSALDLVLAQSAERTSQLAIACELLERARAELVRAGARRSANFSHIRKLHCVD